MQWYKYSFQLPPNYRNCEVWLNDDNINPPWFDYRMPFTEFHIKSGSKTCLVVAGDSWTYGDGIDDQIRPGIKYNLHTQLQHCWAPHIANTLGIDLLQYGRSGCSNMYITTELERLVKYAIDLKQYDKLLICCQVTEDSREFLIGSQAKHPIDSITPGPFSTLPKKNYKDWLVEYEDIFLNIIDLIVGSAKMQIDVDATVFRNLTRFSNPKNPLHFRIVPETWIEHSARLSNVKLTSPNSWTLCRDLLDAPQYNRRNVFLDDDWIDAQAELVQQSMDFICSPASRGLHNNHPTKLGHKTFAEYLIAQSGW